MRIRAATFQVVNGLSRAQKRSLLVAVDMVLTPAVAGLGMLQLGGVDLTRLSILLPGMALLAATASIYVGLHRVKLQAYDIRAVIATGKYALLTTFFFLAICHVAGLAQNSLALVTFFAALLCVTVASRFFMLAALRRVLRNGQQRCRVLIYGAGDAGLQLMAGLRNLPHILPVAFLDDDIDLQAITVGGLPVLSPLRVETIVDNLRIDRVFLAKPSLGLQKIAKISVQLQALGLDVQIVPSLVSLAGPGSPKLQISAHVPASVLARQAICDDMPDFGLCYRDHVLLVSGAGGSVGSELCRQLLSSQPKRLVLYERSELALYTIDRELRDMNPGSKVEIVSILGSVTDPLQAKAVLSDFEVNVVFHAAAYKHVPLVEANPVAGLANNVVGTRVFAEASIAAGVARFVLISTDKAVRPTSVMGGTKRLAELLVQDMAKRSKKTQFSIVRFGNVLGSSGSVLPRFREQIAAGGPITLTDENVTRYFMTLAEAARLVLVAGAFMAKDDLRQASVFVLDMGKPVRIRDLAERLIAAAGLRLRDANTPDGNIEIVLTGLRPGEKLHEELFIENALLPTPHPKILRAHERCLTEFEMARALTATRDVIASGDQVAARIVLQTWVEGFPTGTKAAFSDQGLTARTRDAINL